MPGITGRILLNRGAAAPGTIQRMLAPMLHESFYSSGSLVLTSGVDVEVGWVCHSGSFNDCMPVWNEAKDICIVCTGEEFTDRAVLQELRRNGHQFEENGAGYLVHLYEEHGSDFVRLLNGWVSGIVVDLRNKKILLFNDRYGLNRLYVHQSSEALYFSSEAKSLLAVLPSTREVDLQSLGEFFSCGCTLSNKSLFRGISVLPPASRWVFNDGRQPRRETYFSKDEWEALSSSRPDQYVEEVCTAFPQIISRYMRETDKIGVSLTGGVDSRMILAWTRQQASSLKAYTFGGMYRDSRDVRLARQVARICGLNHRTIPVGQDFQKMFPSLAEKTVFMSDGTMDVTGTVELYVNRAAREIAPIRLTGSYGGEIMRSLVAFKPAAISDEVLSHELQNSVRQAEKTYHAENQGRTLSFIAFKQVPWHHYARFSIESSQLTIRSPFLDNDLVSLAYRAPEALRSSASIALQVTEKGSPILSTLQNDRSSAAHASKLKARVHRLWQEFTFKAEYAYDYGMPHWFARMDHVLKPLHLERLVLGRHKFYHFRPWYRDALGGYVQEILLDSRTLSRPMWDRKGIEKAVTSHIKGTGNYTLQIHRLLTCELALRTLCERN